MPNGRYSGLLLGTKSIIARQRGQEQMGQKLGVSMLGAAGTSMIQQAQMKGMLGQVGAGAGRGLELSTFGPGGPTYKVTDPAGEQLKLLNNARQMASAIMPTTMIKGYNEAEQVKYQNLVNRIYQGLVKQSGQEPIYDLSTIGKMIAEPEAPGAGDKWWMQNR